MNKKNHFLNSHINRVSHLDQSGNFHTQMNTKHRRLASFLKLPIALQCLQRFPLRMTLRCLGVNVCEDAPGRIIEAQSNIHKN